MIAAPLITPEQCALEAKAIELLAHSRVRAVAAKARGLMLAGYGVDVPEEARASPQTTRQDKKRIKELERELLRKDRALAETAALLVLSKKVAAIFNKGEGE